MTLAEIVVSLDDTQRLEKALHYAELIAPIWDEFASPDTLKYFNDETGRVNEVRPTLLEECRILARQVLAQPDFCSTDTGKIDLDRLVFAFKDPIQALQGYYWEVPEEVRLAFFAYEALVDYLNGNAIGADGLPMLFYAIDSATEALVESGRMTFLDAEAEMLPLPGGRAPSN
jgi:hypothetical protein